MGVTTSRLVRAAGSPNREYHVANFVPGGGRLTTSNFEGALIAAAAACADSTSGGAVVAPPGRWPVSSTIVWPRAKSQHAQYGTGGIYPSVRLVGAGMDDTCLVPAVGFTGSVVLDIGKYDEDPVVNYRLHDYVGGLAIRNDNSVSGLTGVRMRHCVLPTLDHVSTRGLAIGLDLPNYDDANNQNGTVIGCKFQYNTVAGVRSAYAWSWRFLGCDFNLSGPGVLSYGGNHWGFHSCMFQGSTYAYKVVFDDLEGYTIPTYGGEQVVIDGYTYHEGTGTYTLIEIPDPVAAATADSKTSVSSHYDIGMVRGGATTFIDVTGTHNVVHLRPTAQAATSKIKGRNAIIMIDGARWSPDTTPGAFDLDHFSREALQITSSHQGGRASYWNQIAGRDKDLTSFLKHYAAEIFDPSVESSVSLSGDAIVSLTGLVAGTTMSASTEERRPDLVIDGSFGGNAYIKCEYNATAASAKSMEATLATALNGTNDTFGMLFVARARAARATATSGPSMTKAAGANGGVRTEVGNDGIIGNFTGIASTGGALTSDAYTFVYYIGPLLDTTNISGGGFQLGTQPAQFRNTHTNATASGGATVFPNAYTDVNTLQLSFYNTGVDLDIAYIAYLKRPMSRATMETAFQMAKSRFRLGMFNLPTTGGLEP